MSLVSIGGEEGKRRRRESTFPNDVSMRATLYIYIHIYYNCRDFDLEREKEEGNRR